MTELNIGMSPSGKAPDFDSGTRRFESGHPSQKSPRTKFGEIFTFSPFTLLPPSAKSLQITQIYCILPLDMV